jgi:uncharacterized SAM-binding protein YcdF (DUF218 family)
MRTVAALRWLGWPLLATGFAGAVTLARIVRDGRGQPPVSADAILLFGAVVWPSGPSPALRARVEHAADVYKRGYAPRILSCGTANEIGAMRVLLLENGVPDQAIFSLDGVASTRQTVEVALSQVAGRRQHVLLVSSPSHMHRILAECARHGLSGIACPARSPAVERRKQVRVPDRHLAWQYLREVVAVWRYALTWRKRQLDGSRSAHDAAR